MSDYEPVAFGTSFEALVTRALSPMPAGAVDRLKAVGFDPTKPILPAYPARVWMDVLTVTCGLLSPGVDIDEAHRRLGRLYMEGFEKTLIGKAVFTLGRAIGSRRMLPRMTRNFRSANNFLDPTLEELGEGEWRMTVATNPAAVAMMKGRGRRSAEFMRGVMEAILTLRGHSAVAVEVTSCDEDTGRATLVLRFR